MGAFLFSMWEVMPIACVVEYISCKLSIRNPGIIMFFYCEIGRKRIDICGVTEYSIKCFCVKIKIIVIGNIFKAICIHVSLQYIVIIIAIITIILRLWGHWLGRLCIITLETLSNKIWYFSSFDAGVVELNSAHIAALVLVDMPVIKLGAYDSSLARVVVFDPDLAEGDVEEFIVSPCVSFLVASASTSSQALLPFRI